jgi:hypothetical protein
MNTRSTTFEIYGNFSWTEQLTHLGADTWELSTDSTALGSDEDAEGTTEHFNTEALVQHLLEKDADDLPRRRVGPRLG